METQRGVIQITKLTESYLQYNEIYYFCGLDVDSVGDIKINTTGDIWEAWKFNNYKQSSQIDQLITFLKVSRIFPSYDVRFITIKLNYDLQ